MESYTQSIAAPTAAPMTDAYPAAAASRRNGFSGLMARLASGATVHTTGQVSFANANAAFTKVWAPPPRRVPL